MLLSHIERCKKEGISSLGILPRRSPCRPYGLELSKFILADFHGVAYLNAVLKHFLPVECECDCRVHQKPRGSCRNDLTVTWPHTCSYRCHFGGSSLISRDSITTHLLKCRDPHDTLRAKAHTNSCLYICILASGGFCTHSPFMYQGPGLHANASNQKHVEILKACRS